MVLRTVSFLCWCWNSGVILAHSSNIVTLCSKEGLNAGQQFCPLVEGVWRGRRPWGSKCDLPSSLGSPGWPSVQVWKAPVYCWKCFELTGTLGRTVGGNFKTIETKRRIKRTNKSTKGVFVYFIPFGPPESPVRKHQTAFTVRWSCKLGGFPNKL